MKNSAKKVQKREREKKNKKNIQKTHSAYIVHNRLYI